MPFHLSIPAAALLMLCSSASYSEMRRPTPLYALLSEKALVLASPYGDILMHFSADGVVTGQGPAALAMAGVATTDRGRWWVQVAAVCMQWRNWLQGTAHCYAVIASDSFGVRWRADDGEEGVAQFDRPGSAQR